MRNHSIIGLSFLLLTMGTGCGGTLVQPGHRGLLFEPTNGGVQHEVLKPGWYRTACAFWTPDNKCPRIDDFDVTYSTSKEELRTVSAEGLAIDLHTALKYRPIVSELYLLDTEIGSNYFDEVIGPELRSATVGVLARTSYQALQKNNKQIEDEIERDLRDRLKGKHVEVSSVLIEKVDYAPEILASQKERVVSQEQTLARKQLLENAALQKKRELELNAETKKLELETQSEQKKMELAAQTEQKKMILQADAEQRKLAAATEVDVKKIEIAKESEEEKARLESALRNKQMEKKLAVEQGQIDRMTAESKAASTVTTARGEANARLALAKASAEENRATAANVTINQVMMHAYDALGKLGGTGTTFLLGDYSKLPNWLFPKMAGFQTAPIYGAPVASRAPAAEPDVNPTSYKPTVTWGAPKVPTND